MKTAERMKNILAEHKQEIIHKFNVREIGIFGSYVKNEQKKGSDIDILVEFKEPVGFFKFMELEEYLEGIFGRKVDLVSKKALKHRIGEHILKEVVYI